MGYEILWRKGIENVQHWQVFIAYLIAYLGYLKGYFIAYLVKAIIHPKKNTLIG